MSDEPGAGVSPLRQRDLGVEVVRRTPSSGYRHRSRNAFFASDGGSSRGSRGTSTESSLPLAFEEKVKKNLIASEVNLIQDSDLSAQLNRFQTEVDKNQWKPVVLLIDDSPPFHALAQYLLSNVGDERRSEW